jgi:glyoxylase-like metal-dependent hydrolase (beta-lactamase superfamily II)
MFRETAMQRFGMTHVGFYVLVLLVLLPPLALAAYPPVTVKVIAEQIGDHTYYINGLAGSATEHEGFISNAGFVITSEGVVVLDALGSPSLAWAMREEIRKLTEQPIVKVIVTHYHADHIYGLQVFADEGAEIIAPRGAYEYLEAPSAATRLDERRLSLDPWVNDDTRLVRPDLLVEDSHTFQLGGVDFQIDYLGRAHSVGDMTLYVIQDKVLFSGDIIFRGRVPFVGDADTNRWLQTLDQLGRDGLNWLVPGHGPASGKPARAIAETRDYLAHLRKVMGQAVDNFEDFATAYDNADWSRYEKMPAFDATHRRNAYQVFLSMESELLAQ